jgi:ADP-ribosylglycohydrolase
MPNLEDKIRGCFVGVAIGDALGMPWELCSREEIQQMTQGRGVLGLEDVPSDRPRKIKDGRGLSLGDTTDDWQLTRAVAKSLMRSQGLSIYDMALSHVEALEEGVRGWGGSTRDAVGEFKLWFDTRGREGRRPGEPVAVREKRGHGNGVMMKIAPLACYRALHDVREDVVLSAEQFQAFAEMTHRERYYVAVERFIYDSLRYGMGFRTWQVSDKDFVRHAWESIEDAGLKTKLAYLFDRQEAPRADECRTVCGTACLAEDSAGFSIATSLRNGSDFRGAVLEAINAGGDTDTNGAIVGAMVGARVGFSGIPKDWCAAVPSATQAFDLATEFCHAFGVSS